jgi:hypothetical protein
MASSLQVLRAELNAAVAGAERGLPAADELCLACVGLLEVDGAAVSVVRQGASYGTFGASSERSRRIDDYQFTFGEGPCLDASRTGRAVLAPDLDSPDEVRWPGFSDAVLREGVRGVYALPIMVASVCVGALDLFRELPGPLRGEQLAGALVAAELASLPLLDALTGPQQGDLPAREDASEPARIDHEDEGHERGWAEVDRVEVYQATGMLIAQLDVDADEALLRLRAHAIGTGQTASQVAWAIIERRLVLERDDHGGDQR